MTTNLIAKFSKEETAKAIVEGLNIARHFRQPDMKESKLTEKSMG